MKLARALSALGFALGAACGSASPARPAAPAPVARVEPVAPEAASSPEPASERALEPEVRPAPAAPVPVAEPAPPAAAPAAELNLAAELDLAAEVAQVFAAHCYECHGPGKRPKGGLRLSDLGALLARPAEEALIVPGDVEHSALHARLVLPADDEDRMPPEGPGLADEELALVRAWIEAGAPLPPGAQLPATPGDEFVLDPTARAARDQALARLTQRGAHARRVASGSEAVEVDLSVALPRAGAAELTALAGLEPCLVELSLVRLALAEADLAALAPFTELRRLRLGETPLGDAAVAALAPLAKLESLDLFGTRVTDAAVPHLARLTALRRLYVGDTGLTPAGLEALAAALPGCVLVR